MKAIEVLEPHVEYIYDANIIDVEAEPCASISYDEEGNVLHYGQFGYYTDEYLGQYTYQGYDCDAQVDCFYNNARHYDPTPGRFFEPDPS